jgi:tRNA A-37 threonylcarbamoyl transferase component Bud32
MSTYTKNILYGIRNNSLEKAKLEVELQNIASSYNYSPKILHTKYFNDKCVILMENLNSMCIADKYGDKQSDIPLNIWDEIRKILTVLFEVEGIEYIDITPYNFIEKEGKVYIIDFGDAYYTSKDKEMNWFLKDFINGENDWNPDFK